MFSFIIVCTLVAYYLLATESIVVIITIEVKIKVEIRLLAILYFKILLFLDSNKI